MVPFMYSSSTHDPDCRSKSCLLKIVLDLHGCRKQTREATLSKLHNVPYTIDGNALTSKIDLTRELLTFLFCHKQKIDKSRALNVDRIT